MNIRAKIYGGGEPADEPILKTKRPKGTKPGSLDSVAVPRETRRQANARAQDRHRLTNERARVTYQGRDRDVALINLSGGGAMIEGKLRPNLWDRIDLHLGSHGTVECRAIWIKDGQIGLEFAHETHLDWPADQVATVLRHVIERTFPHIEFTPAETAPVAQKPTSLDPDDHRRAPRHPLIWKAVLHHDYQSTTVRLRNISDTGAMIQSETSVRVGAQPLLELSESVSVAATVEWAIGDQVGLRFTEPFDRHWLAESRPTVAPAKWCPPSYLKAASEVRSQDHWQRLDLHELRGELEGFLKR